GARAGAGAPRRSPGSPTARSSSSTPEVADFVRSFRPVEIGAHECAAVIAWAEAAGFAPWPPEAEAPTSRCTIDESAPLDLWIGLAERVRITGGCESVHSRVAVVAEAGCPWRRPLPGRLA